MKRLITLLIQILFIENFTTRGKEAKDPNKLEKALELEGGYVYANIFNEKENTNLFQVNVLSIYR